MSVVASDPEQGPPPEGARVPKYYLVKQELLKQIEALDPGQPLAAERTLSLVHGTSRTTVRQALHELTVEGRLQRVHGSGTYVAAPKLAQPLRLASYTEEVRAQGLEPGSRLLEVAELRAGAGLAELLEVPASARVLRVERLRLADGEPMALEVAHLAARRFPRLRQHLYRLGSLYRTLSEVYGVEVVQAEQTIETVLAGPDEAALLATEVGLPLLMLCQHSFDADGRPVEWVRSVYRGDRYKFVTRLSRPEGPAEPPSTRPPGRDRAPGSTGRRRRVQSS